MAKVGRITKEKVLQILDPGQDEERLRSPWNEIG
jgi:hypothetical protein